MTPFKGKAIYNPTGKAGEYSPWACNFYTGCSNDCSYCYLKRGVLSSTWDTKAQLKKCFRDEEHALEVFKKELLKNGEAIKATGLFFTFTSDPMLEDTIDLTIRAMDICTAYEVPVIVLTKCAGWVEGYESGKGHTPFFPFLIKDRLRQSIAFGFTLTGRDDLEPGASSNQDRITAMEKLHKAGFITWASIEPIVDLPSSYEMIARSTEFCDLYKVGLQSGKRYPHADVVNFVELIGDLHPQRPIYLKDSIIEQSGHSREVMEQTAGNFVGRDYNIFK